MKQTIPVGHRVLIRQDKIEEKLGRFIVPENHTKKEQVAQVSGVVVAVGKDCWKEFVEPWCAVGDRVLYQRYSGMKIPDGKGGFIEEGLLIILNDLDITAKVIEDEENV